MKLAAVVPALFALISLCGSPVPAPPGSVSGVAFYDANRNGIHDSCDRPLALATVVATAADGTKETATSGPDGAFHIDKVNPGLALVTLAAPDGELWHITTDTADGTPGAVVEVKDLRDTGGVEIGATSPSPMSATQISVSGVIFNDANGNGQIDKDECGIPQSWANLYESATKIGGPAIDSGPSADGTYFVYGISAAGTVHPNLPDPGWVATTGRHGGGDPCSLGVVPMSWHGTKIYEANIGFIRGNITSTVSGTLFDDANSNGVRDSGESGVSNVQIVLEPSGAHCRGFSPAGATSGSDGAFVFNNVQPGLYGLYLSPPAEARTVSQVVSLGRPDQQISVAETDVTADIPALVQPVAYANIQFFNDINGNGLWDADEGPAPYVYVCISTGTDIPDFKDGPGLAGRAKCATSDRTGSAEIGTVAEGDYSLFFWDPPADPPTAPALTNVHLSASSPVSVNVPVAPQPMPTPSPPRPTVAASPEVIPSGAAAQTLAVCYSDPNWVQPPFEDGYDPAQPFYASWGVDEAAARAIYGLGIYAATPQTTPDAYVWSAIAGLSWREPPGCDASQANEWTPIYDLVGLEPISAVADQHATQITVRPTGHGLYGIVLSPQIIDLNNNGQAPVKSVIFVNESGTPITQCNALGVCQWD